MNINLCIWANCVCPVHNTLYAVCVQRQIWKCIIHYMMCGALLLHSINSVYLNATATIIAAFANGLRFVCHKHRTQLNGLINDYRSRYAAAASRLIILTIAKSEKWVIKKTYPIGTVVCASLSEPSAIFRIEWTFKNSASVLLTQMNTHIYFHILRIMLWWYLNRSSKLKLLHVHGISKIAFKSI